MYLLIPTISGIDLQLALSAVENKPIPSPSKSTSVCRGIIFFLLPPSPEFMEKYDNMNFHSEFMNEAVQHFVCVFLYI